LQQPPLNVVALDTQRARERFDGDRLFDLHRPAALDGRLGLHVRSARFAALKVLIKTRAVAGGRIEPIASLDQIGFGELAEFLFRLPAPTIGTAPAARPRL